MIINCQNCDERFEHRDVVCPKCGTENEFDTLDTNICEEECCDTCKSFEPTEDIQCKPFAKIHKWNRPTLEIDCPDSFRCKVYDGK